jgi:hypothetical protein
MVWGLLRRFGQNHIYIYGVYTVFLAGKSPNIQSYTVYIYGSGQFNLCANKDVRCGDLRAKLARAKWSLLVCCLITRFHKAPGTYANEK